MASDGFLTLIVTFMKAFSVKVVLAALDGDITADCGRKVGFIVALITR